MKTLPTPKILCVDDDPAIATAISMRLAQYDVEVLKAFFGTHGVWIAVTQHPDVVITDLRMPNGNGDYVVECLKGRADTWDIPVIVLTGCREDWRERSIRGLGVEHYLRKPIQVGKLLDAVRRHIELRPVTSAGRPCSVN
jgi:response regulator RpfG family c-di-GMP phosphodiesterase